MLRALVRLLRPAQWVKNAFVAAPLLFSGGFTDPRALAACGLAFVAFSLAASLGYVLNDLADADADRRHPVKRHRPIASGAVGPLAARALAALLLAALVALGVTWSRDVLAVIAAYLLLTAAYSWRLKRVPVLDIFAIAAGFVLRVYAGALAIAVPVSDWMFVTTLALAVYLAAIKRRQELAGGTTDTRSVLASYTLPLLDRYALTGALCAITFYSLFVVSAQPGLVLSVPLVMYGLFRYWFTVETQGSGEDPTQALLRDWQLMLVVIVWGALVAWLKLRG